MLITCLKTGRGISFSRMFAMQEYPADVLPLYAQGHSVARYLIESKGKRHFVHFLGEGLRAKDWPRAVRECYGHKTLLALQNDWLAWVRSGSSTMRLAGQRPRCLNGVCPVPLTRVPTSKPPARVSTPSSLPNGGASETMIAQATALSRRLEAAERRLGTLESRVPEPARDGVDGRDGRDGPTLEELLDAIAQDPRFQAPEVDQERLVREVLGKLPPVRMEILHPSGDVSHQSRPLGEAIQLQLRPLNR